MKAKRKARSLATERAWAKDLRAIALSLDARGDAPELKRANARVADLEYQLDELRDRFDEVTNKAELAESRARLAGKELAKLSGVADWVERRSRFFLVLLEARDNGLLPEGFIDRLEEIDWRLRDFIKTQRPA